MPSLLAYVKKRGCLPLYLTFSLAALMAFYSAQEMKDGSLLGYRDGMEYRISDDKAVLEFFSANTNKPTEEFVSAFLAQDSFFGQDLTEISGLKEMVAAYLDDIKENGMRAALCRIL